ncbi:heavy metal-responsive transcriptional regulator [Nocardia salmonicida]|uniref:heavy metal-responsive transcriptional regulator n=1 Tax=Nocardia salmonicida TaxID=53431 RepID=UPI0007A4CA68|nr:heavy metal-responsive transcriptional regulator [Nocardia salmonicida]
MKIGEVAELTGVSTKTIRFYEDSGLVPPPGRTHSGHRRYGNDTVDRLRFIRRCQTAGMSLTEVREILALHDRGESPCGQVEQTLTDRLHHVRARIAELEVFETYLTTLLAHAADSGRSARQADAEVCWILESAPDATRALGRSAGSGLTESR